MNSRARTRDLMWRKARRKQRIAHSLDPEWDTRHPYYSNLHQYSKNKIHCSCPWCSPRTRNKGRKRNTKNYAPSINYKISDLRKILNMNEQEQEYSL